MRDTHRALPESARRRTTTFRDATNPPASPVEDSVARSYRRMASGTRSASIAARARSANFSNDSGFALLRASWRSADRNDLAALIGETGSSRAVPKDARTRTRRILGFTGVIFAQFVTVGSRGPRVCGFRSRANCQTGAPASLPSVATEGVNCPVDVRPELTVVSDFWLLRQAGRGRTLDPRSPAMSLARFVPVARAELS